MEVLPARLSAEADPARRATEQRALARAEVDAERSNDLIAWTHVPQVVEDAGFRGVFWFTTPACAASFGGGGGGGAD